MVFSLVSVESNSSYATNNNPYMGKSVFQDRHKCDKCELTISPYISEINLLLWSWVWFLCEVSIFVSTLSFIPLFFFFFFFGQLSLIISQSIFKSAFLFPAGFLCRDIIISTYSISICRKPLHVCQGFCVFPVVADKWWKCCQREVEKSATQFVKLPLC